jgi:hypothetical protein
VALGDGEIVVDARLATDKVGRDMLGPLAGVLRPWEPVEAAGPVRVTRPGRGEWEVRRLRVRDFPLPREVTSRLIARVTGDSTGSGLPFRLPAGVRAIRVRPSGATLFRTAPT